MSCLEQVLDLLGCRYSLDSGDCFGLGFLVENRDATLQADLSDSEAILWPRSYAVGLVQT